MPETGNAVVYGDFERVAKLVTIRKIYSFYNREDAGMEELYSRDRHAERRIVGRVRYD